MPRKPSKKFVQPEQLWEGYCQWRDSATNPHDRKLNDEFALHIWNIAKHLTQHHRFARYSEHIKQEMISDAYVKVVSNLKNVKEQYRNSLFSYFTNICWCAFMDYLTKHYRNQNLKKKLLFDAIQNLQNECPNEARNYLLKKMNDELANYEPHNEEDGNEE